MKDIVISARNIWRGYRDLEDFKWVLRGIDLDVARGDFITILGNRGAGKTPLLRVLGFWEVPDRGTVYYEGRVVGRIGPEEYRTVRGERVVFTNESVTRQDVAETVRALLVDEPLDLLDQEKRNKALDRIVGLTDSGTAIVVATRDPVVAACGKDVYRLSDGRLIEITGP